MLKFLILLLSFLVMAFIIMRMSYRMTTTNNRFVYVTSILFIGIFSIFLYLNEGNPFGLYQWLTQGKSHYELLLQVDKLGGINGMITKIQRHLEENPNDIQGWLILGKLYQGNHEDAAAEVAFKRAKALSH